MLRRTKYTILYVILMVVGSLISSCRPTPQYPEALLVADSLTQCNADSAVRLLQELAPTLSQAKEPVRRYHQLLTVKAQDKAFIPHTSDSLILDVLHYYQEEGDPRLLPEACYYAGRVTRDLGDAPQARVKSAASCRQKTGLLLKPCYRSISQTSSPSFVALIPITIQNGSYPSC